MLDHIVMQNKYKWSNKSSSDTYEVSSLGDRRFSALFAVMSDGRTIEQHYQCDVKGYDVGGTKWRRGKGKPSKILYTAYQQWDKYLSLWEDWAKDNKDYIDDLKETLRYLNIHTLSDSFATNSINQARALSVILNNEAYYEEEKNKKSCSEDDGDI